MCAATVYVQPQRGPSTFGKRWPLNGNVLAVQRQRHAPRRSKFLKYLSKVMPAWWREPSVSRESGSPLSHMRAARGASADSDAANAPSAPPPSGLFLRTLQDQQLRSALTQYAKNDMTLTTHHSRRRPRGSRCSTPTTTVIPPLLRWFVVSITLSVMLRGAHRESKKESRSRSRSCQLLCCWDVEEHILWRCWHFW